MNPRKLNSVLAVLCGRLVFSDWWIINQDFLEDMKGNKYLILQCSYVYDGREHKYSSVLIADVSQILKGDLFYATYKSYST